MKTELVTDEKIYKSFHLDRNLFNIFSDEKGFYHAYDKSTKNPLFSFNGLNKIIAEIDLKAIFGNSVSFMVEYPVKPLTKGERTKKFDLAVIVGKRFILADFEDNGIFHRKDGGMKVSKSDMQHIAIAKALSERIDGMEYHVISIPVDKREAQEKELINRLCLIASGCRSFCLVQSKSCKDGKIHVYAWKKRYTVAVNATEKRRISYTVGGERFYKTILTNFKKSKEREIFYADLKVA